MSLRDLETAWYGDSRCDRFVRKQFRYAARGVLEEGEIMAWLWDWETEATQDMKVVKYGEEITEALEHLNEVEDSINYIEMMIFT